MLSVYLCSLRVCICLFDLYVEGKCVCVCSFLRDPLSYKWDVCFLNLSVLNSARWLILPKHTLLYTQSPTRTPCSLETVFQWQIEKRCMCISVSVIFVSLLTCCSCRWITRFLWFFLKHKAFCDFVFLLFWPSFILYTHTHTHTCACMSSFNSFIWPLIPWLVKHLSEGWNNYEISKQSERIYLFYSVVLVLLGWI